MFKNNIFVTFVTRNINALLYSCRGLSFTYGTEASFREELVLAVLIPIGAILLGFSLNWPVVLFATVLVLITELLNTGLEGLCDKFTTEQDEDVKNIKDTGSAAVFLAKMLYLVSLGAAYF